MVSISGPVEAALEALPEKPAISSHHLWWEEKNVPWAWLRTCCADAGDIIVGQNLIILTYTDDTVSIFIRFAAVGLAVAAVQLHLDLTLAMALHG